MSAEVAPENSNLSETWTETKSKKRKQSAMDVDSNKNSRPHFPPVKKALLVYIIHLFISIFLFYTKHIEKKKVFYKCVANYLFQSGTEEMRKIPVPPNRYTPLKENWMKIFTPVVQHLNLNIRFNLRSRMVEIRVCIGF